MSNFVTLLVEDDPWQRQIMSDLLRDEGFEVLQCATAEAAELVVATTGSELLALVTDQNLAGEMTGADLAEFARGRYPRLNIVVVSGSSVDTLPARSTFLRKPFAPRDLLDAIRD